MRNLKFFAVATAGILAFSSCKKEDDNNVNPGDGNPSNDKGIVSLHFDNVYKTVGNSIKLASDAKSEGTILTSANNQQHKFQTLKYIISDVSLITKDGKEVLLIILTFQTFLLESIAK